MGCAKCSGQDRAPDAPVLTATVISTSEILLSWTKPNGNGTDIDGYEVRQWNGETNFSTTDLLADGDDDNANVTLLPVTGLTAGVKYYFIVRAEAAGGGTNGVWSSGSTKMYLRQ